MPWETIKFRFHLFFILSIVLLILPIAFNIAIHIKFGFHPTQHYFIQVQVLFTIQTFLGALGMNAYIVGFEDSWQQTHHDYDQQQVREVSRSMTRNRLLQTGKSTEWGLMT